MKKIMTGILIFTMIFPVLLLAAGERKDCVECAVKTNAAQAIKINNICNDFTDILCKDVKAEERRSCSESDSTIINKNSSAKDVFNFAQGCFKSGVTSFVQFFTDFIPELLKGIWEASKGVVNLGIKSISGNEPGLWSKFKGMYESTTSVAADIYEAVQENPGAYFEKIWSKVIDVVGPMVANYDCLKPQKKVEKICGFVAEWVVPPAMLAKILVRGIKEVKFLKESGALSVTASGKLAKALEYSSKRSVLTLKELQAMELQFKTLGYTREEFALIYKTGALDKLKVTDLKALTTAEGKAQKLKLLDGQRVFSSTPVKAAVALPVVALKLDSDFISITNTGLKGEVLTGHGQIVERIITDGVESAYKVRMVDVKTNKVFETVYSIEKLAKMNAKPAVPEMASKIADIVIKDKKYPSLADEFAEAEKKFQKENAHKYTPDDMKNVDISDVGMEEFKAAQQAQIKLADEARAAKEAKNPKAIMEGVDTHEIGMDEFHKANAPQAPAVKYENGIDFKATDSPGLITRSKGGVAGPAAIKNAKPGTSLTGAFNSNFISVMTKNSMGVTTYMPAQILKKVFVNGKEQYVIRMMDKSSNTFKEITVSLPELKIKMRAKDAPKVEKDIGDFKRQTGFQDDLLE